MCTVADHKQDTYNGWTNRETWAVGLWINNEQGMQERVHEQLREALTMQADGLTASKAGEIVREYLDDLFDVENYDGSLPGGLVDMLTDIGSLYRVDWHEIGASFLRDVQEQDGEADATRRCQDASDTLTAVLVPFSSAGSITLCELRDLVEATDNLPEDHVAQVLPNGLRVDLNA